MIVMILYGHCIRGIGSLTAAYASGLPVIDQGRVATRSDVWGPRCPLAFAGSAHSTQLPLIINSGSAQDWVPAFRVALRRTRSVANGPIQGISRPA